MSPQRYILTRVGELFAGKLKVISDAILTMKLWLQTLNSNCVVTQCDSFDCLLCSRGLGIERIFVNFLKVYCDPESLVLVLNTTSQEEVGFISAKYILNYLIHVSNNYHLMITAMFIYLNNFRIYPFQEYFLEQIENSDTKPLPRVITSEFNTNERYVHEKDHSNNNYKFYHFPSSKVKNLSNWTQFFFENFRWTDIHFVGPLVPSVSDLR